jgi:hypothetical protein
MLDASSAISHVGNYNAIRRNPEPQIPPLASAQKFLPVSDIEQAEVRIFPIIDTDEIPT